MDVGEMECLMQEDFMWEVGAVSDMCAPMHVDVQRAVADMTYFDENTGEMLDERLVRAAEAEELSRFAKMGGLWLCRPKRRLEGPRRYLRERQMGAR